MPRPKTYAKAITDEQKQEELCAAIRDCMPLTYACDLVGIPRRTVYEYLEKDEHFRTKVEVAKASAIKGLVALTAKQGGSWRLLKNLGKDEFKEHVEIAMESKGFIELQNPDGTKKEDWDI